MTVVSQERPRIVVTPEIIVIGAGIAGASLAAELAESHQVALFEMETQPGYHTTGRSAAMFVPSYGPAPIRGLTRASSGFFKTPGTEFVVDSLLSPRPVMMIARSDQQESLQKLKDEVLPNTMVKDLTAEQLVGLNPLLKPDYATSGILDVEAYDIDVAALHQGYLRQFKNRGGQLVTNCRVEGLETSTNGWDVSTSQGSYRAKIVVNAAGAWADEVNVMAGLAEVGLTPKRRTMVVIDAPADLKTATLPMTIDIDEQFFLKPETGQLLLSPADETPSLPCDAQPEELDIAVGIDRIEKAFDLQIRRIQSSWAGLRSFVADGVPVAGFLDSENSFFLLAGQGGYGIQTCPALSRLAASVITGNKIPDDIQAEGISGQQLCPLRLL